MNFIRKSNYCVFSSCLVLLAAPDFPASYPELTLKKNKGLLCQAEQALALVLMGRLLLFRLCFAALRLLCAFGQEGLVIQVGILGRIDFAQAQTDAPALGVDFDHPQG